MRQGRPLGLCRRPGELAFAVIRQGSGALLNLTPASGRAFAWRVLPAAITDVPMRHRSGIRPEIVITAALLCGTLVVGFATLRDYGIAR
jgi:hypothetical protein